MNKYFAIFATLLCLAACGVKRDLDKPVARGGKDAKMMQHNTPTYGNNSMDATQQPVTDGNPAYLPPTSGKTGYGSF